MRISDWSSDVCSSDLKIVGEPRAEQRQRMAEGGAAVIFVGVARHAEVGVIAILLAPACVIAGGEDMAVRRRTEPRVLIRSGEHTSELQSLMRISYAVFCLKKKNTKLNNKQTPYTTA